MSIVLVDIDVVATIALHEYAAAVIGAGFRRLHHRLSDRGRSAHVGIRMIADDEENAEPIRA